MQVVPVRSLPNQTLQVQLQDQPCTINVYQQQYGLFMDVLINGTLIIGGVICENLNRIVRSLYLGFDGDFVWFDTQGTDDPIYTGLGTRWLLVYLTPTDLGGAG